MSYYHIEYRIFFNKILYISYEITMVIKLELIFFFRIFKTLFKNGIFKNFYGFSLYSSSPVSSFFDMYNLNIDNFIGNYVEEIYHLLLIAFSDFIQFAHLGF